GATLTFRMEQRDRTQDWLPSGRPPLVLDGWIKELGRKSFPALCFGEDEDSELGVHPRIPGRLMDNMGPRLCEEHLTLQQRKVYGWVSADLPRI
ncbi:mCG145167, partial [Mus musculus]